MLERRLKTRLFDLEPDVPKLARLVRMSVSEVYRIKEGKRQIGHQFIVGALTAFPERKFEELFYVEVEEK